MHNSLIAAVSAVPTLSDRSDGRSTPIVEEELEWRVPHHVAPGSTLVATRWRAISSRDQEHGAETGGDRHVVKIVLRTMDLRLRIGSRIVQNGVVTPGTFHVTRPGESVHACFKGPYDVLHLHLPNTLIEDSAQDMPGPAPLGSAPGPAKDPAIDLLARALLQADQFASGVGRLYADCVGVAIVARLLAASGRPRPKVTELPRWRLKRALDYIEARLEEPVSLAEIAASAGLTAMHFAAQFKAATGLRPHEYLLRRRIERAQEMLAGSGLPLVEIALSVGFQTQSHFTTVFKRFVGLPPRAWRERCAGSERCTGPVPGWQGAI